MGGGVKTGPQTALPQNGIQKSGRGPFSVRARDVDGGKGPVGVSHDFEEGGYVFKPQLDSEALQPEKIIQGFSVGFCRRVFPLHPDFLCLWFAEPVNNRTPYTLSEGKTPQMGL
jgi:hypothetical protein